MLSVIDRTIMLILTSIAYRYILEDANNIVGTSMPGSCPMIHCMHDVDP